jgi:hypothetical protein
MEALGYHETALALPVSDSNTERMFHKLDMFLGWPLAYLAKTLLLLLVECCSLVLGVHDESFVTSLFVAQQE